MNLAEERTELERQLQIVNDKIQRYRARWQRRQEIEQRMMERLQNRVAHLTQAIARIDKLEMRDGFAGTNPGTPQGIGGTAGTAVHPADGG